MDHLCPKYTPIQGSWLYRTICPVDYFPYTRKINGHFRNRLILGTYHMWGLWYTSTSERMAWKMVQCSAFILGYWNSHWNIPRLFLTPYVHIYIWIGINRCVHIDPEKRKILIECHVHWHHVLSLNDFTWPKTGYVRQGHVYVTTTY